MEDKPPTEAGQEVPRSRTPRAAFSTPEQPAPQAKPGESAPRRAPKPPPPVTFQPPTTDATASPSPASSEQPAGSRRRSAPRTSPSQRATKATPAKAAPSSSATPDGDTPAAAKPAAPAEGTPTAGATATAPANPTAAAASAAATPQPSAEATPAKATPQPSAEATPAKATPVTRNARRQPAAKATPAKAAPESEGTPEQENKPASPRKSTRPADRPVRARKAAAQVQETLIPDEPAPTPPARKSARKATTKAQPIPPISPISDNSDEAATAADSPAPNAVSGTTTPDTSAAVSTPASPEPVTAAPAPAIPEPVPAAAVPAPATPKPTPAAAETERVTLPPEEPDPITTPTTTPVQADRTPQQPPASTAAAANRTEAWAKLVADPGHAPELLALAAVQTIGPRAKEWARRHREAYPNATDAGLARLATNQFTRFGTLASIFGAVAGSYAPIALLGSSALAHAELVLHLAAAYGLDPTDEARAAELLVLTRVHPTVSDAEEALNAARQPAYEDGGITGAAWRFGRMAATQAGGWAALRVVNRLFPGSSLLVATTVSRNAVAALGTRATRFYSQVSQDSGNRV